MSITHPSPLQVDVVPGGGGIRTKLHLTGVVQGVGFRPFAYKLAKRLELAGFVVNTSSGVTIEVEGEPSTIERFIELLRVELPPAARIDGMQVADCEPRYETDFAIDSSVTVSGEYSLVSTDLAMCDDCRHELTDPHDRRFGYPFVNCTNCGPRYTIIQDVPYDRPATTMSRFRMCAECVAEYADPTNRRFHAQPNACPRCGPGLALVRAGEAHADCAVFERQTANLLRQVRKLLRQGGVLAIKGLGGFHLACDATNADAVTRLRSRKRRGDKPFAVMARDLEQVRKIAVASDEECGELLSRHAPIVVLRERRGSGIAEWVGPQQDTIGIMLPSTPLHYLLFEETPSACEFRALVMTSGNVSEEPIVISNEEALTRLGGVADYFVLHDRDIYMRVDDSVAHVSNGKTRVVRRSRGYAPEPIDLGIPVTEILACGAELKNTFCLTKDHYAILSQHIGDMENYETLVFFEETLDNLKRLFRVEPRAVAYDLHPQYLSTRWALERSGLASVPVQHHHAHIASCAAENHLQGKVIGVALDGTGYGTDGAIWGGEFLVADYLGFERRAHFRYVPLAGGDAAVRQPWRAALAYLQDSFGPAAPSGLALSHEVAERPRKLVQQMIAKNIHCIPTSSCGRLFDAVASLTGLRHEVTYEGQAAIELEVAAATEVRDLYPYRLAEGPTCSVDFREMIRQIVDDCVREVDLGAIAGRFHSTLASAIADVCVRIRQSHGLSRVCLSGGSFQNGVLLERTLKELNALGFEVYTHSRIPPNDGGVALGQAVIANARLAGGLLCV
jgi:hydrogenase maturation protein HypF